VSPVITRPFSISGQRKKGEKNKHGKSTILTDTAEKTETEIQTAKEGKRKY